MGITRADALVRPGLPRFSLPPLCDLTLTRYVIARLPHHSGIAALRLAMTIGLFPLSDITKDRLSYYYCVVLFYTFSDYNSGREMEE